MEEKKENVKNKEILENKKEEKEKSSKRPCTCAPTLRAAATLALATLRPRGGA